ncbi:MAG: NADPH-dependent 7-cyano-7-deazaguanine reductase QueF [bacterium]
MSNPLGKSTVYKDQYDSSLLFPIPRENGRASLGVVDELLFNGRDEWSCFEVSWLDERGKPHVGVVHIAYSALSTNIVESKSLKLYLNSFNNSKFSSEHDVAQTINNDLKNILKTDVCTVEVTLPDNWDSLRFTELEGVLLDDKTIPVTEFVHDAGLLSIHNEPAEEILYSHLLRSLCPVTGQPDWGTVWVKYTGKKIDQRGLLRYIISLRNHLGFHEHCCELIFMDILRQCDPEKLCVACIYTRRGGISISPVRFSKGFSGQVPFFHLIRQ